MTAENLQAARDRFATFKNEHGDPLGIKPKFLLTAEGSATANSADLILDRQLINGGESNPHYKKFEHLKLDYL